MPPVPNTFAGATLDRAGHLRADAEALAALRADPAARTVVLGREGALLTGDPGTPGVDAWAGLTGGKLTAARLPFPDAESAARALFLGVEPDGPLFALDQAPAVLPEDVRAIDLRAAATVLSAGDAGLLGYASGLLHWHRAHRFCGRCGQPTAVGEGGHVLRCADGHTSHPRTDPVVIMLVTDGDRVILGRQPVWPAGRFSALAGFVEPGEPLEAAVAREVSEEAGVEVGAVHYRSSQPWPFPASLMLGFEAEWVSGEPRPRDGELEEARWFTRAELAQAAAADARQGGAAPDAPLGLPPASAIARRLIEGWLEG